MRKVFTLLTCVAISVSAWSAAAPPVTFAIDSQEAFNQWVQVNANDDDYEFSYDASGYALYNQSTSKVANDWLISPAVSLTAGKSYKLTWSVQNLTRYSGDKQDFDVYAATAPDVASMTSKVFSVTGFTKTSWPVEKTGNFAAPTSGDYYFGLHLISKAYQGDFAVVSLKVEEIASHPGAVSNLTVTAAPKGELKAELSWNWPDKSDLGGTQFSITGAKIYRGTTSSFSVSESSLVKTVDVDATPGAAYSTDDTTIEKAGKYYYKVVPFNESGASTEAPVSAASPYIGVAQSISGVKNLKAALPEGSDSQILLTWDAPTASDGGYFDPAAVKYKITRTKDGASTAVTVAEEWSGTQPFVDSNLEGLGSYVYSVYTIYNGSTSFSSVKSNAVVAGGAMSLPYSNAFSAANSAELFSFFHGPQSTRDWNLSTSKKALYYYGEGTADAWAVLPMFNLEAGKTYKLDFRAWVQKTTSPKNLAIAFGTEATAEGLTNEIYTAKVENMYGGAQEVYFSVPATGNYFIGLHCFGATDYNDIYVSDINLAETATAPLPVTEAKAEAAANGELKANLSWINPGKNTAGAPMPVVDKVEIKRGNEVVATLTTLEGGNAGSYEAAVPEPGIYKFTLTVYLGDIASQPVEITSPWIGYDTPKAPESVTVAVEADSREVSFTPVAEGIHGGYINTAALTYIISRNDVTLSTEVKSSPFVDDEQDLPLARYVYSVAAVNGDFTGEATSAEAVTIGDAIALPYEPSFDSKDAFDLWTLNKWSYNTSSKKLTVSSGDSWAFTPPLDIKAGKCDVTFRATCYSSNRYPENMTIYLVKAPEQPIAADAQKIGEYKITSVSFPDAVSTEFNVAESGKYYLAFGNPTIAMTLGLTELKVKQTYIDPTVGIDNVEISNEKARYFNLQGIEIAEPTPGEIVIVRRGSKATREIFLK